MFGAPEVQQGPATDAWGKTLGGDEIDQRTHSVVQLPECDVRGC